MARVSSMRMVYIAGPFFNSEQRKVIDEIEAILANNEVSYFSPRDFGVLANMTPEEKEANAKEIFEANIEWIAKCNTMIAVVDGSDAGTIFEMGYATRLKEEDPERRTIISLTNKGKNLNVMLRECVDAHLRGFDNLGEAASLAVDFSLYGPDFMEDRGEAW